VHPGAGNLVIAACLKVVENLGEIHLQPVVTTFHIPLKECIGMRKGRGCESESLFDSLQSEKDL